MLARVGKLVLPAIERSGPIEARIIDDTGFPKKGRHSVGVTRQYCGQLGKQDNCQVAVSLSLANHDASLPIAYRLYLPEDWAKDQARRDKARVPATIAFQTKPEIAFEQIKAARAAGLPEGVVLMDAGYGNDTGLRTDITALGLRYVAGIGPNTSVWAPGEAPMPPRSRTDRDDRSCGCNADSTSRSRSRHSPSACRKRRGKRSLGAREPRIGSSRALPGGECGRRIAITC
jgi:SRSO17 transposase